MNKKCVRIRLWHMAYIIGTVFNEFAYSFLLVFISDIGFLKTVKTELVKNDCYAGGEKQYQSNPLV